MKLLSLNKLAKIYDENTKNAVSALKNITFEVNRGDYVSIMGESGAGKSTLLDIIATLDKPTSGQAILNNQDLGKLSKNDAAKYRRKNLGFVFQNFNLLDSLSNRDNIYLPLVLNRTPVSEMEHRIEPLIKSLNIEKIIDRYPSDISGGQQQRIAIARALITQPDLLLADEPTGSLDSNTSKQILNLFNEENQKGQTIIMVTHSSATASYSKRTLFIKDGKIYHDIYRGDLSLEDYQEKINNTMITLTRGDY
ncbi:ABC transporter ATP-binding protein [Apilactobacillus timberlakei]|uniref:ABC transporter ATP-binding protein n=1 Tax=Apilactobacillus timberlakei TaxID=2008380 RepID=UPI0011272B64|nr:ABC transporter ATP-binding protein [Apilactobacillus timberlakei]TPR18097.1 ABC transporter ATP-binding protein [Apilactobacillus timberlakei]